jgi:hypothetical protein
MDLRCRALKWASKEQLKPQIASNAIPNGAVMKAQGHYSDKVQSSCYMNDTKAIYVQPTKSQGNDHDILC